LSSSKKLRKAVDDILFVVEAIDGYRVGRNVDPRVFKSRFEKIEEHVKKAVDRKKRKALFSAVDYMVNLPAKDPSAKLWSQVFLVSRFLLRITLLFFIAALFLNTLSGSWAARLILYSAIGLFYFSAVSRWYSLNKVLDFYEARRGRAEAKSRVLRSIAQDLMELVRELVRQGAVSRKKARLNLFNTDYRGIRVLKKPGWLRDHYVVELE